LIGDPTYGRARQAPRAKTPEQEEAYKVITDFPRQALHAWLLGFQHPSLHTTVRFESAYPADMADLIAALRRL
jgi:23S rRNA pseudouridine1911/1915/1917 synthase